MEKAFALEILVFYWLEGRGGEENPGPASEYRLCPSWLWNLGP